MRRHTHSNKLIFTLLIAMVSFPGEGSTACGTVLFQDDFSGDLSGWDLQPPSSWSIVDGKLKAQLPNGSHLFGRAFVGDSTWTDYCIEFDMVQYVNVNKQCYFRFHDLAKGYFVNFRSPWAGNPGAIRLFKLDDWGTWTFGSWHMLDQAAYPNTNGTEYHLEIRVVGPEFTFFVDGQEVLRYVDQDAPITTGKIGLCAYNGADAEGAHIEWDNFSVTNFGAVPIKRVTWGRLKSLFE